jgi:hypothetical protein
VPVDVICVSLHEDALHINAAMEAEAFAELLFEPPGVHPVRADLLVQIPVDMASERRFSLAAACRAGRRIGAASGVG